MRLRSLIEKMKANMKIDAQDGSPSVTKVLRDSVIAAIVTSVCGIGLYILLSDTLRYDLFSEARIDRTSIFFFLLVVSWVFFFLAFGIIDLWSTEVCEAN